MSEILKGIELVKKLGGAGNVLFFKEEYYLIANVDKYDNVSHYRVDRIRDIEIVDVSAKPQRKVKGLENGLNLPKIPDILSEK